MSGPQLTLSQYFTRDHRNCDAQWAEVEAASEGGGAGNLASAWGRFEQSMRTHMQKEEEVLFPAVEAATGMSGGGPTEVMRSEHNQMRGLLDQMAQAFARGDHDELLDQGDTLLMLIQQHNQKEEHILYPMCENALDAEWTEIHERLASYPSIE
jgi:iron-sulfur cluster repair protein YtfE (RIC family)